MSAHDKRQRAVRWPAHGGDMAQRIRHFDWGSTPLGPIESWSESLRAIVDLCLGLDTGGAVWAGNSLVQLYNDHAIPLWRERHPSALGRPAAETWSDLWPTLIGPAITQVRTTGEAVCHENLRVGADLFYTLRYSAIHDAAGQFIGVFISSVETTEHVHAEEALHTSKHMLERIFISAPVGISVLRGESLEHVMINPAAATFMGPVKALLGRKHDEFFAKAQGDDLRSVMRDGQPRKLNAQTVKFGRDERLRMWDAQALPLFNERGIADSVMIISSEMTDRLEAEAAQRTLSERDHFRLKLAEALRPLSNPLEIQRVSSQVLGEHLGVNRVTYVELSGEEHALVHEGAYARNVHPLKGSFPLASFGKASLDAMRSGLTIIIDEAATDGRLSQAERQAHAAMPCSAAVRVPLLRAGKLAAFLSVQRLEPHQWTPAEVAQVERAADRSWVAIERANADIRLRHSEQRLSAALIAGQMAYWHWDTVTNHVAASETMNQLFGIPPGETFPSAVDVMKLIHPDDAEAHQATLERSKSLREGWHREFRIIRPVDQNVAWLEERAKATIGSNGALEFDAIVWDITARKTAELALRASEEHARQMATRAEEANRAKDEFLATLSHELRTPLAPILLWSRALRSGAVPASDLPRALDAIVLSGESQSRLIEDLLDLSRLKAGKLQLEPQRVRVDDILRKVFDMLQPTADQRGVQLRLETEGGLGLLMLDPVRVQQVLWNLVTNAVKFTPAKGQVCVRLRKNEGSLELEVADTGRGISSEFLPQLFQRFRQADMGERRHHGGLGIGLALCRSLVELHGGTITAYSAGLGQGATFTVRLPLIHAEDTPSSTIGTPPARHPSALRGIKVLLIEDDPSTRDVMRWTLTRAGAEVVGAASAHEALELLNDERAAVPAIIVCDIGLPGMSGYDFIEEAAKRSRARGARAIPACAVSAHAREVDRRRAIEAGFELYLAKPLSAEALLGAAEELAEMALNA